MDSEEPVRAFHAAGEVGGPLYPIYHFSATRLSALLPSGACFLDLFCGSGRLLTYLLAGRPDLSAIGIDLSGEMLRRAKENAVKAQVLDRVTLVQADAALADRVLEQPVAAIASLSALHHCPSSDILRDVLRAVQRIRDRDGSAVWLFDLVRPPHASTANLIPSSYELSTGLQLDPFFREDWINSLRAGWTFEEMRDALKTSELDLISSEANFSQVHWCPSSSVTPPPPDWNGPGREGDVRRADKLASELGFGPLE